MRALLALLAGAGGLGLVGVVALGAKPEPLSVVAYEAGIEAQAEARATEVVRLATCGVMLGAEQTVAAVELFADAWGSFWHKPFMRRAATASLEGFDCTDPQVIKTARSERDRSVERFYWVGLHLACKGKTKLPLQKIADEATATFGVNARDALWLLFDAADRSHKSLSDPMRTKACVTAATWAAR